MEALGVAARSGEPQLRDAAALFLHRYVRMMFHDGDLERANSFEHYNPLAGQAATYRGIDDVQHSWIADHIVSYVMGVRAHDRGITIDPYPFELERAELAHVQARGRELDVRIAGRRLLVSVDGAMRESVLGEPLEIPD
jgi:hypothetical protein